MHPRRSGTEAIPRDHKPRHTAAELNELLDGMQPEVLAGVNDPTLAARFDIRADDVRAWRRRQGLRGRRGRPKGASTGIDGALEATPRGRRQLTTPMPNEPLLPRYVERGPLDYVQFGRLIWLAVEQLGWSIEDIAGATGYCDVDVLVALDLDRARQTS